MIDQNCDRGRILAKDFSVELLDVQGLFGGRNVLVSKTRTAWVQSVGPRAGKGRLVEKQYVLILSGDEMERICHVLLDNDFLSLQSEERLGIPDEARPEIVLTGSDGTPLHSVAAWERCMLGPDEYLQSDRRKFDSVYREIRRLEEVASERTKPVRKGTYKGPDSWLAFKKRPV